LKTLLKRKRDKEATRESILESAEELFAEKGFADTSLSEIAKRAKVTKSLIHHHFETKEKLWEQVKQRLIVPYLSNQMKLLYKAKIDVETFRESIRTYFYFLRDNPNFVRIMTWMSLEGDCALADQGLMSFGASRLKEGQDRGELRDDIMPEMVLSAFLASVGHWYQERGAFLSWAEMDGDKADELYLDTVLKLFTSGLLPENKR
jgi:TetR/AcrR family transcriptional regulator